jgi:hypothetical protein
MTPEITNLVEELTLECDRYHYIKTSFGRRAITAIEALSAENERLKLYEKEHLDTIKACGWMHEDDTLKIGLGRRLSVEGIAALRSQRDELRAELARLRAEPASGWVKFSTRNPTKEDAGHEGCILVCGGEWETGLVRWDRWANCRRTHWQRLPAPPPAEPTAEERMKAEDEKYTTEALERYRTTATTVRELVLQTLRHARNQEKAP